MTSILVIDDDSQTLELISSVFEEEGSKVLTAENGKKGIDLFRQSPTAVVITDIIMPVKDGIETIMELKKEFPELKIIAISSGSHVFPDPHLKTAKLLGANKTMTKPLDLKELVEAVKELTR